MFGKLHLVFMNDMGLEHTKLDCFEKQGRKVKEFRQAFDVVNEYDTALI